MGSPKNVRREPSPAIIYSLMRGLEWDREYRHCRSQGQASPQYVTIREGVNHHRKIKGPSPFLRVRVAAEAVACLA